MKRASVGWFIRLEKVLLCKLISVHANLNSQTRFVLDDVVGGRVRRGQLSERIMASEGHFVCGLQVTQDDQRRMVGLLSVACGVPDWSDQCSWYGLAITLLPL